MSKLVYVIVVTYNGMKWIERCLSSLQASVIPLQVLVIDNLSQDGTPEYVQQHFPEVELILSGANLGFGKANNIGLRKAVAANADYVFLLNQDAWIENETLTHLLAVAEQHPSYGIISPLHYTASKIHFDNKFFEYVQPNTCPDFIEDFWFKRSRDIYETGFVNAAAWLVSRACLLRVGGFDPLFPHYGEDVDYVQRVQFCGFKVGITPNSSVCHDAVQKQWSEIMWDKKRMLTIYLSDIKNINGSLRSNLLIFWKSRFDELSSHLLYRRGKRFLFVCALNIKLIGRLATIARARKASKLSGAFLN